MCRTCPLSVSTWTWRKTTARGSSRSLGLRAYLAVQVAFGKRNAYCRTDVNVVSCSHDSGAVRAPAYCVSSRQHGQRPQGLETARADAESCVGSVATACNGGSEPPILSHQARANAGQPTTEIKRIELMSQRL